MVKKGSGHSITIPLDRIAIVPAAQGEPRLLQVDGRIQWLTAKCFWQFLPERPLDGFGIGKAASPGDRYVVQLQERLKALGHYTQWNFEHEATYGSYQVVYDDDGYYFRNKAHDGRGDQILVVHA